VVPPPGDRVDCMRDIFILKEIWMQGRTNFDRIFLSGGNNLLIP
jgi:hypothetical protein